MIILITKTRSKMIIVMILIVILRSLITKCNFFILICLKKEVHELAYHEV